MANAGKPVASLYFPVDTLISVECPQGVEVAIAGSDGMFGWTAIASLECSPFRAVACDRHGLILRIPVGAMLSAVSRSETLRSMMFQYLVIMSIQMSEAIAAQGLHQLDARVARWLLIRHDRIGGDEIRTRHDEIARNLGVRRASITDCLHLIEGDGFIRCRRGRILIRDRPSLERMARGCYGAAEAQYRSAFGEFRNLATA